MKLSDLLRSAGIGKPREFYDYNIESVVGDSRRALSDTLFVCIKGSVSDGHAYAGQAYTHGCRSFLCQYMPEGLPQKLRGVNLIIVEDTRAALADIAAELYGHPEREMTLFGITGTKGKTTAAMLTAGVLNAAGIPTGYIGTNGINFTGFHFDSANTTPESCDIYEYLSKMKSCGVSTAVIEVSSQALYMNRVRGLMFDACVFTNLYHDHIGGIEHPDMEHYKNCKKKLFSEHCRGRAIINTDDAAADEFISAAKDREITSFSVSQKADFSASDMTLTRDESGLGTAFTLRTNNKCIETQLAFPGGFSVSDALAAAALCAAAGVTPEEFCRRLPDCRIPGRFETLRRDGVDYVIDYAHNGESLRSALTVLREYNPRHLICLYGSVGGRTTMRRAELGKVAAELADFSILTSDNPDCEPPMRIIEEIAKQYDSEDDFIEIPDRKKAIEYAAEIAREGDIVLLAGKGHERYQLICGCRVPFCEREILEKIPHLVKNQY